MLDPSGDQAGAIDSPSVVSWRNPVPSLLTSQICRLPSPFCAAIAIDTSVPVRVVSMPSTNVFDRQDKAWKDSVLLPGIPRVSIEAGVTDGWRKYVGLDGACVGVDRFGESAPAPDVYKYLGVDVDHLVAAVQGVV